MKSIKEELEDLYKEVKKDGDYSLALAILDRLSLEKEEES
ncbi:unnamed protein product [marine sediment metagenome]|uniref:Uncharacterized protein n=1 Tax=marine sediment metagenome TaxID=412755 RepID=X1HKS4_9ZZZZ